MKRTDGRGKPIYSDKVWNILVKIGRKLEKLGYKESQKKPNLFYKKLEYEEKAEKKSGWIYADFRGNKYYPIYRYPEPHVYSFTLPHAVFVREIIILHRSGCEPRYRSYYEEDWTVLGSLYEFPSGYCKRCGMDIIDEINYELLNRHLFDQWESDWKYKVKIYPELEAHYCPTCREIEYAKKQFQNQYYSSKCEMCGVNEADIEHHFKYEPEIIMDICRSCHGKIHGHKFPNPLWTQDKQEVEEGKI